MSNEQTKALVLVPRADLVRVEKEAAEQVKRADRNVWKSMGVGLLGAGTGICAIASAHVIAPVLLGGVLLEVCGLGGALRYMAKSEKYKRQQAATKAAQATAEAVEKNKRAATIAAAEEERLESLRLAAKSILMQDTGAYAVGQELRIDVSDETPKILRIETVSAGLKGKDRHVRKISARLYEAVAQADGGLKRGKRVANIRAIACSIPLDPGLAPSSPPDTAEKKLPPCRPV